MTTAATTSPSFGSGMNIVQLDAANDGKISHVSLYFNRAEVSRVFRFSTVAGANKLVVSNLPDVLEDDTIRVEGHGTGTVHDVSVGRAPTLEPLNSDLFKSLKSREQDIQRAIIRSKKCLASVERYATKLTVEHVNIADLGSALESYEAATKKYDDQLAELEKDLTDVRSQVAAEQYRLDEQEHARSYLHKVATIWLHSEASGDVKLKLIYFVRSASWNAKYDIQVSTESKGDSVHVLYKAAISQTTGESWLNVPLTLETASPSSGVALPAINPWRLKLSKAPPPREASEECSSKKRASRRFLDVEAESCEEEECEDDCDDCEEFCEDFVNPSAEVSSKGDLGMAYRIAGLVTAPSGGGVHSITIVDLKLPAKLTRFSIPRVDTRTHMRAKVGNTSEYTLIPGKASVYVDGSLISTMNMFLVSPDETFNCPLGLDRAIRIVYHPRESNASRSGFYTKTSNILVSQRFTVHNTRLRAIPELNVIDQIPVAEDSQITVTLKKPALPLPSSDPSNQEAPSVSVESGVRACWYDAEDCGNLAALGKDGKLKWVCSIPAQQTVNLLLQWEVTVPSEATVLDL